VNVINSLKEVQTMRTDDRSEGEQLASKKAYAPPKLPEYGSVAKLTEGGSFSGTDTFGPGALSASSRKKR